MKVYIAYDGYLDRHGNQTYKIIGVYTTEFSGYFTVKLNVLSFSESGFDVSNKIVDGVPTTFYTERDRLAAIIGKVEEHILIN